MQRARRTALLVTLALLGAATLTGCRSEPGVAIYIGGARHTQHEVDDLAAKLAMIPTSVLPQSGIGGNREQIVKWLVLRDLIKRTATAEKWDAPKVDVDGASAQLQTAMQQDPGASASADKVAAKVRAVRPVIALLVESQAYVQLAQQHAKAAQPSDADYAELFTRAKAGGLIPPGTPEAEFRQGIGEENAQLVAAKIGLRNLLADMLKKADVVINPKYAPAEWSVLDDGNGHELIVLSLGGTSGSAPVREAPASPPPAQAPVS